MKRPLRPDEQKLWSVVAATVHPLPGRATPVSEDKAPDALPPEALPIAKTRARGAPAQAPAVPPKPKGPTPWPGPELIEPNRHHRIVRERDPIAARLDLHGNSLGDAGVARLATALARCPTLSYLNLRRNAIGAEGVGQLARVLGECVSLTCMNLLGNAVGAGGAEQLRAAAPRGLDLRV